MQKFYTHISQITGDVIVVEADGVGNTELAEVITRQGTSLAQVIRLDGKKGIPAGLCRQPRHLHGGTRYGSWVIRCASPPAPCCWDAFSTGAAGRSTTGRTLLKTSSISAGRP